MNYAARVPENSVQMVILVSEGCRQLTVMLCKSGCGKMGPSLQVNDEINAHLRNGE